MKKYLLTLGMVLAYLWSYALPTDSYEALTRDFVRGEVHLSSISVLSFGPEGILFLGDSKSGMVYAMDLEDRTPPAKREALMLRDIEPKLAALLGTDPNGVIIHDLAVNPLSQQVYLAVSRADAAQVGFWRLPNDVTYATILLRVDTEGNLHEVPLNDIRHSSANVPALIDEGKENWRKSDQRTDAITDIAYADGKLYVAGLSNEAFASTLRVLNFPFDKKGKAEVTTVEVYHVAHGKSETEAPIRTLLPYTINGTPYILASYTCTPFVSIPVAEIKGGKHVKSKTLAELGAGNMPIDIIAYQRKGKDFILMSSNSKALVRIDPMEILKMKKGLTEPLEEHQYTAGLPHDVLSKVSITQIDNLNDSYVLTLQREPNGKLSLVSYAKDWL